MVKATKPKGAKDLESIIGKINSEFGPGSIMRLGDAGDMNIERISTGALTLDLALGNGLPRGRIVEVFGDSGSAKTTLSLHVIAEEQKLGNVCAFLDVEHAIDPSYAKALGVDIDNLFISQPDCVALGEFVLTRDGYVPIEEAAGQPVLNIDDNNTLLESSSSPFPETVKHCFRLKTNQGTIIASGEHKVKQGDKYVLLEDLKKGDYVEVPFLSVNDFLGQSSCYNEIDRSQAIMLGMMLADGSYAKASPSWTKIDEDILGWFHGFIESYHPDCKITQNDISYRVAKEKRSSHEESSFAEFIHKYLGSVSKTDKFIPKEIFHCSEEVRAGLVRGMWSCDGHVATGYGNLQYDTISKNMAYNLSAILSSLGVIHYIYKRKDDRKESYCDMYRIVVSTKEGLARFNEVIGLIGEKGQRLNEIDISQKESSIVFPSFVWNIVFSEAKKIGMSLGELSEKVVGSKRKGGSHLFNKKRWLSIDYLKKINDVLRSPELDKFLSLKTIYTKIMDITPVGEKTCMDIHVKDFNNFVCQNIAVHNSGEAALDICLQLVESGEFSVIVVDSVAALVPRSELEGDMGDASMGVMARLMSQAMRKLTGPISKSGCTVIFINQERDMINSGGYGPRTTTCGGKALKFYASVRIDVTRIQTLKKGNDEYGIRVKAKVIKNKTAPPMRVGEYDVIFGEGISTLGCIVDLAEEHGIISKRGAWYSYNGSNVGQGKENTIQWLKREPAIAAKIEEQIKANITPIEDEEVVVEEIE